MNYPKYLCDILIGNIKKLVVDVQYVVEKQNGMNLQKDMKDFVLKLVKKNIENNLKKE